jgi:hypothetical protein
MTEIEATYVVHKLRVCSPSPGRYVGDTHLRAGKGGLRVVPDANAAQRHACPHERCPGVDRSLQ